jgi:hypothetical protein
MAEEYRVTVVGAGMNFDKPVSEAIAKEVLLLVLGGKPSSPREDDKKDPKKKGAVDTELSIGEYIGNHNAKTIPSKLTAIGNYFQEHDGADSFTKQELLDGFESADEPSPGYFDRDIRRAVGAKWIAAKRDAKDTYYVTGTGKKALADNFGKSGGRLPQRVRRKKSTAKKASPSK